MFTVQKVQGFKAANLWSVETNGFARLRLFRGLFIQGEIGQGWDQIPIGFDNVTREWTIETLSQFNRYVGAGYNWGQGMGGVSSEISLMYNITVANDENAYRNPIDYRFAFTWWF
jgi:hypothetical protein